EDEHEPVRSERGDPDREPASVGPAPRARRPARDLGPADRPVPPDEPRHRQHLVHHEPVAADQAVRARGGAGAQDAVLAVHHDRRRPQDAEDGGDPRRQAADRRRRNRPLGTLAHPHRQARREPHREPGEPRQGRDNLDLHISDRKRPAEPPGASALVTVIPFPESSPSYPAAFTSARQAVAWASTPGRPGRPPEPPRTPPDSPLFVVKDSELRDAYHEELDSLADRLVEMTRLVRSAMARAVTALLDADLRLSEEVISGDEHVNKIDAEIEGIVF